ncbi:MAG: hypothetical protein HY849_09135 [Nitrosomonadales bacterium]|nr:hypothetical protein [Nitrosomonadales bacterium]
MTDTIELVRFRLQAGKTAADWLKANEKINEWAARQPGFRFRSVSETDDGEWLDLVYWASPEDAAAAGVSFEAEMMSVCAPLVAHESVVCLRSKAHVMQQG